MTITSPIFLTWDIINNKTKKNKTSISKLILQYEIKAKKSAKQSSKKNTCKRVERNTYCKLDPPKL